MLSNSYQIIALYSGSKGNAFLLRSPKTTLLIDAGLTAKKLQQALNAVGLTVDDVDAIFITHDHGDHISALATLLSHNPKPVYATAGSAQVIAAGLKEPCMEYLHRESPCFTETVGDISVQSFVTPHDSQMSVGYRMRLTDAAGNVHEIGYATDLGYISPQVREGLLGCETVVLESNHDMQMLLEGPYPAQLKERIHRRYGHLSNEDCAAFAAELVQNGTRQIMLVHLSEINNTPELALGEVMAAIGSTDCAVAVAQPNEPVEMCISMDGAVPARADGLSTGDACVC